MERLGLLMMFISRIAFKTLHFAADGLSSSAFFSSLQKKMLFSPLLSLLQSLRYLMITSAALIHMIP